MNRYTIGRMPDCDIVISDPGVSRTHAEIIINSDEVIVRDLNSSNGTFVNGNRIYGTEVLRQSDVLKVANTMVTWENHIKINNNKNVANKNESQQILPPYQQQTVTAQSAKVQSQEQQIPSQQQQTVVVIGKQKSVGMAFALAFFFGPLGLLYASVVGGIVMFIAGILIAIVTLGFGLIFVWVGCIIWAVVAAGNANKTVINGITQR